MGYVKVKARFSNPETPQKEEELELLADTGAIYTVLPSEVMARLAIKPVGQRRFKLADGRIVRRDYGLVRVGIGDETGASIAVFGQEGDVPVLGVHTLEALALRVNPVTGRLEPLELLLL